MSGSSNSNSSGIASILDDYNPEVCFILITIRVIVIAETLNVFMNIPIKDLEKSSVIAVAWVVIIILVTFSSTVSIIIIIIIVIKIVIVMVIMIIM